MIHRHRAGAGDKGAAVEIDHDRTAGIVEGGSPDVEAQAVLAGLGGEAQPGGHGVRRLHGGARKLGAEHRRGARASLRLMATSSPSACWWVNAAISW